MGHIPVLCEGVLALLGPVLRPGARVLDATVGGGGHAEAILPRILPGGRYLGLDRDPQALVHARARLLPRWGEAVRLVHAPFAALAALAARELGEGADAVLFDLGLSSLQLDDPARGFSFRASGPLDMRMDPSAPGPTAAELVNRLPERELAELIRRYGEERRARRVAAAIARARQRRPLARTDELAELIARALGPRYERGRIHPATRTFQALRLAVNDELEQLERALAALPEVLLPGGRAAIIAFHSLEDRLVKQAFREGARAGRLELLVRKPVRPSAEEVARNPRARSARLRAVARPAETAGPAAP